jgi:hypothetical protein
MRNDHRAETATETAIVAVPRPTLVPQSNGRGALYAGGVRGNRGGGRPPDEFRELMRSMATRDETLAQLDRILDDHTHPHFLRALELAAAYGYGRPVQQLAEKMNQEVVIRVLEE